MDANEVRISAQPQFDPHICKFVVDREVYNGAYNCNNRGKAKDSPLLEALFALEGVEQVLVAGNTITVAKTDANPWPVLGKKIGAAIRETIQSGQPCLSPKIEEQKLAENPGLSSPEAQKIRELLRLHINPAVAAHGGRISLIDVKDDVVYLELSGGCQGCGMASVTLKQGVEQAIKEAVPTIKAVYDVTDHASGKNPYYAPTAR